MSFARVKQNTATSVDHMGINQRPAMNESKARVWKKIVCFYALTMLFSLGFGVFILHAGKLEAGDLLYVTDTMWSPGLVAFSTKKIFGETSAKA